MHLLQPERTAQKQRVAVQWVFSDPHSVPTGASCSALPGPQHLHFPQSREPPRKFELVPSGAGEWDKNQGLGAVGGGRLKTASEAAALPKLTGLVNLRESDLLCTSETSTFGGF